MDPQDAANLVEESMKLVEANTQMCPPLSKTPPTRVAVASVKAKKPTRELKLSAGGLRSRETSGDKKFGAPFGR